LPSIECKISCLTGVRLDRPTSKRLTISDSKKKTTAQQLGRLVEIPTERRAVAWIGQPAKADFVHYSNLSTCSQLKNVVGFDQSPNSKTCWVNLLAAISQ
jgi:hypothetical protein